MSRRTWGVGCWGSGVRDVETFHARGEEVAVVVRLTAGHVVLFRGKLLRDRPFRTRALARLAVDRAYLASVRDTLTDQEREVYGLDRQGRPKRKGA